MGESISRRTASHVAGWKWIWSSLETRILCHKMELVVQHKARAELNQRYKKEELNKTSTWMLCLVQDDRGRSSGQGIVTFHSADAAELAIQTFNGTVSPSPLVPCLKSNIQSPYHHFGTCLDLVLLCTSEENHWKNGSGGHLLSIAGSWWAAASDPAELSLDTHNPWHLCTQKSVSRGADVLVMWTSISLNAISRNKGWSPYSRSFRQVLQISQWFETMMLKTSAVGLWGYQSCLIRLYHHGDYRCQNIEEERECR